MVECKKPAARREHHVDCFAIFTRNRNPDSDGRGQGFEVGGNQLVKAEKDILPAGQHDELWEMWPKLLQFLDTFVG